MSFLSSILRPAGRSITSACMVCESEIKTTYSRQHFLDPNARTFILSPMCQYVHKQIYTQGTGRIARNPLTAAVPRGARQASKHGDPAAWQFVYRNNFSYVAFIVFAAIGFEVAYGTVTESFWRSVNKGVCFIHNRLDTCGSYALPLFDRRYLIIVAEIVRRC